MDNKKSFMEITFDPVLSLKDSQAFPGAMPVQLITIHYRFALRGTKGPVSGRVFVALLNQVTKKWMVSVTHQTLHNWENGSSHPGVCFLQMLRTHASPGSWQVHFANDMLAAMFPEKYRPSGLIGKILLQGRRARRVP